LYPVPSDKTFLKNYFPEKWDDDGINHVLYAFFGNDEEITSFKFRDSFILKPIDGKNGDTNVLENLM
jgi:hypothetical protein